MTTIGLLLVFLSLIAFAVGAYELMKHTVVGRNTAASTQEQIRKFSRVDGCCYLGEGAIALIMAFSDYIFGEGGGSTAMLVLAVIFVCIMIFNFIMAKKMM